MPLLPLPPFMTEQTDRRTTRPHGRCLQSRILGVFSHARLTPAAVRLRVPVVIRLLTNTPSTQLLQITRLLDLINLCVY